MRKFTIAAILAVLTVPLTSRAQGLKEVEGSFLEPLQQRDSILVADQLRYGFTLDGVVEGTELRMQDYSGAFGDTLVVVRNWKIDTLKVVSPGRKGSGPVRYDIRGDVVIAPFEPGTYHLPQIAIQRITLTPATWTRSSSIRRSWRSGPCRSTPPRSSPTTSRAR